MKQYVPAEIYYGVPKRKPKDITKPWCAFYYYKNPAGKMQRFQERGGINRLHTVTDRTKAAKELQAAINEMLAAGYNPFVKLDSLINKPHSQELMSLMPVCDALDWAVKKNKKKWRHTTYISRKNVLEHIKMAFAELGYSQLSVGEVKRFHINIVLNHCWEKRGFGTRSYNGYLETIKSTFSTLRKSDIIESNPAADIEAEVAPDSVVHMPLTSKELQAVSRHLQKVHPAFYSFCKTINGTLIRPLELMRLKIKNVDFEGSQILILPMNSKTGKLRWTGVPEDVMELLKSHCDGFSSEYYVWSAGMNPGPNQVQRNKASDLWLKLVKKGLGIDKTMYSLKHSEVEERLNALKVIQEGIGEIQKQAGHASARMTLVYDKNKVAEQLISSTIKKVKTKF